MFFSLKCNNLSLFSCSECCKYYNLKYYILEMFERFHDFCLTIVGLKVGRGWFLKRFQGQIEDNSVRSAMEFGQSNSGNSVYLHISHRIVALSANHFLLIEHRRIHGTEWLETLLYHRCASTFSFDFPAKLVCE